MKSPFEADWLDVMKEHCVTMEVMYCGAKMEKMLNMRRQGISPLFRMSAIPRVRYSAGPLFSGSAIPQAQPPPLTEEL
jgi:hypothetical protein